MLKKCNGCGRKKAHKDFHKNKNYDDGFQPRCKECMRIAYNKSRAKKPHHYYSVSVVRQQKVVDQFKLLKAQQCCLVCGESDDSCLDMHHRDPQEKEGGLADMVWRWSWERILKEIAKCVWLCSNCHRKYHAGKIKLGIA